MLRRRGFVVLPEPVVGASVVAKSRDLCKSELARLLSEVFALPAAVL